MSKKDVHFDELLAIRVNATMKERLEDVSRYELSSIPNEMRKIISEYLDSYRRDRRFRKWLKQENVEGWEEVTR